jgi:hypothetical protein
VALVKCSNCEHQISSRAKFCPKCATVQQGSAQPGMAGSANASPPEDRATEPPQSEPAETCGSAGLAAMLGELALLQLPVEEWFYIAGSGRSGPVSFAVLKKMVAEGHCTPETSVWKAGLPDWVKFSDYHETAVAAAPEHTAVKSAGNRYVWALAFAPLWGGIVQIMATETRIALTKKSLVYYSQMWWIIVVINIMVCYLDYRNLKKNGQDVRAIDKWLCLLVPVYLYRRDIKAPAKITRFCIWIASAALTIALFVFLNGMYTRIYTQISIR